MTADPMSDYLAALPRHCRDGLNVSRTVIDLVQAAVTTHGWTPQHLADESARDLGTAESPGAVIVSRLRKAATHPPVGRAAGTTPKPRLPFCSDECRTRAGWLEDDRGNLTARCPCRTPQEATAS